MLTTEDDFVIVDDSVRFGPSNADEWLNIDVMRYKGGVVTETRLVWHNVAFVHRDDVIQLRDWLTRWLETHP